MKTQEILALYARNAKGSMDSVMCDAYSRDIDIHIARKTNPGLADEDKW